MEKVFDMHVHYTYDLPLLETIELFRKEFILTGTEKCCFLSLPHKEKADVSGFDGMQNLKGLFLKHVFQPNAYAFAGLEHPFKYTNEDVISRSFEKQATEYALAGYDGMKMLEGYPSLLRDRKGVHLNGKIYDRYYAFLEENGIPIVMHAANPTENWDVSKASVDAVKAGRVYDESYPTKTEITDQVFGLLKKHPKLKLILAHWGFMTDDKANAERFLGDYENTFFDITPGGEQYFNMIRDWSYWSWFIEKYSQRILYGTDTYAFPGGEGKDWENWVCRRPSLIRDFFETDKECDYIGEKFIGRMIAADVREKIYRKNAEKAFGNPKKIDTNYLLQTAESLLGTKQKSVWAEKDLQYIIENLKNNL